MNVRTATEDDLEGIGEIDLTLVLDPQRLVRIKDALFRGDLVVAQEHRCVVGVMDLHHVFFGETFVSLIAVHPEHRRQGIATALLMEAAARARGDRLFVSTVASHPIMHGLLLKNGFLRAGEMQHIDPGETEVFYVRYLR